MTNEEKIDAVMAIHLGEEGVVVGCTWKRTNGKFLTVTLPDNSTINVMCVRNAIEFALGWIAETYP